MAMASMPACAATELVAKGRESAALLKAMLGQLPAVVGAGATTTTPHGLRDLAEQILRCCDRALAALHRGTGTEEAAGSSKKRKPEGDGGQLAPPPPVTGSKRMRMSREERGTRVEKKGTIMEDGFLWRKYGQKDIHGSNHPRLYFRCTYKDDRGCMARRQVQQSDTDPGVYLITYFDEHTCCRDDAVEPPAPAPFVINFGLSIASDDHLPSGCSSWPSSCDDDGLPVETHTSSALWTSPEEELQAGASCNNVAEFIVEQSTPVPEQMGMMRLLEWEWEWEWDPMNGCLDWEFPKTESSFDIDGFVRCDFDYIDLP